MTNAPAHLTEDECHGELFCADEGFGPFWLLRSDYERHAAKREIAGFTGEPVSHHTAKVVRARVELAGGARMLTVDPAGPLKFWQVEV